MTDKETIHRVLSLLWKNDDIVGKMYYNQALQDAQTAFDFLLEEAVSDNRKEAVLKKAHELAKNAELISDKIPKSTLIAVAIDMAEWCDSHSIEEPKTDWLQELQDKLDSLSKEEFKKVWAKYELREESVSEDLEEAINSYIENNFHGSQTLGFFSNRTKEEPNDEDIALTFKAGAEWQKEQIMSKAIVYNDKIYPTTYENEPTEFCLDGGEEVRLITEAVNSGLLKQGDKVKVIIVKED